MGGDNAPDMVIAGADLARERYPNVKYILFGDESRIAPLLESSQNAEAGVVTIRHTEDAIDNDMKVAITLAVRESSSMRLAIDAVAAGEADCVVSAGVPAR